MPKYRKKGQIDIYQKQKTPWGEWLFAGFVVLIILGAISQ